MDIALSVENKNASDAAMATSSPLSLNGTKAGEKDRKTKHYADDRNAAEATLSIVASSNNRIGDGVKGSTTTGVLQTNDHQNIRVITPNNAAVVPQEEHEGQQGTATTSATAAPATDAPLRDASLHRMLCVGCIVIVVLVAFVSGLVTGVSVASSSSLQTSSSVIGVQQTGRENNNDHGSPASSDAASAALANVASDVTSPPPTTMSQKAPTAIIPTLAPAITTTTTTNAPTMPPTMPFRLIDDPFVTAPTNDPPSTRLDGDSDDEDPSQPQQQQSSQCMSGEYLYAYAGTHSGGLVDTFFGTYNVHSGATNVYSANSDCEIVALAFDRSGTAHGQCAHVSSNNTLVKVDLSNNGTTTEIAVLPWKDGRALMAYNPIDDHFYSLHLTDDFDTAFDLVKLSTTGQIATTPRSAFIFGYFTTFVINSNGEALGTDGSSLYSLDLEGGTPQLLFGQIPDHVSPFAFLLGFDGNGVLYAMGTNMNRALFTITVGGTTFITSEVRDGPLDFFPGPGALCPL